MKIGFRTPSLKRRFAARTSWKRYVRHSMGLKAPRGMGFLTNPKKALYNRIYNRTTIGLDDLLKTPHKNNNPQLQNTPTKGIEITNTGSIIRSSHKALTVTSKNFEDLRKQVTDIYNQRVDLQKQLSSAKMKSFLLSTVHFGSYLFVVGFFYKGIAESRASQQEIVRLFEKQLSETYVNLTFSDKSQLEKSWLNCIDAFNELVKSEKIWDMTYAEAVDKVKARTVAATATKRASITYSSREIEFIKSDLPYLFLPNTNGADLFFFPTFLVLFKSNQEFGLFDLRELNIHLKLTAYIEEERVPTDTEVIQHTWKKANKDGSMDKRFKGNYQIPIVKYGDLLLESQNGLEEAYMFSNFDAFDGFARNFKHHIELLNKN